jgi:hypothetical protein
MVLLQQLWLPILLSGVFVFIASSILHMLLAFWHSPDAKGFSNEDEVGAAIRKGNPAAGMYMIPHCTPEAMKNPATQEKFRTGPVAVIFLRKAGPMNMGAFMAQWFAFCLLVSFFCALLAVHAVAPGAPFELVFHYAGLAAMMAYSFGVIPDAIWWGHPWRSAIKHIIDGIIYAVITGLTFAWLWPAV